MLNRVKEAINNERGEGGLTTILILVMLAPLILWLVFKPTYQHVLITRHDSLQNEVDYMLETGARLGYVDITMLNDSKERLVNKGFDSAKLQYSINSTTGQIATDPVQPLKRGTGLIVEISYPYDNAFIIDGLIGIPTPNSEERLKARGYQMVERWE